MFKKYLAGAILFVLIWSGLTAQHFGGFPPSVQWRQINSPVARVIFPAGLDSSARRIAGIETALDQYTLGSIGPKKKKIDIVLHPTTTISNGYVSLGPFRSEFYLTPAQNNFELGSLRWQDLLALHEYRHVQQYNNFNVGLSHAFRIVFGQEGQEFANAIAIPNWFWEGDAVYQETLVSAQGRGRLPYFFDGYRALWLAGKQYSYMKLRNGSLRDFTLDHYKLGYMLVAYGREKYGEAFWKNVTHDAASFKGLFYPLQHAIKKYSQRSFTDFTADAFNYFRQPLHYPDTTTTHKTHFIADQEFPAYTDSGRIVFMQTSYKQLPAFIEKQGAEERRIRVRDASLDNHFSYRHGKIVYASYRPAARWGWNDYSELQVLDIASGRQVTLTHQSKYFSPDMSEDGTRIIAVDVQPNQPAALHVLDAATGFLIKRLPNPDSLFYSYPVFTDDNQVVVTVRQPSGSMALALVNTERGELEYLMRSGLHVLGRPTVQHDTVYFSAADHGYDHLFALTLKDKKLFALDPAAAGIGIYQPAVNNGQLMFTSFTANGFRLQQTPAGEVHWSLVEEAKWSQPLDTFGIEFSGNKAAGLLPQLPPSNGEIKPYPKTTGLFNFHSLLPYGNDPDYSVSLVGNNVLNTMETELSFLYNRNEQFKQAGASIRYSGWYPYVNIGANYIFDRRDFLTGGRTLYWNESQANAGLSLPLNLSKGRSITRLTMGSDYVFKHLSYQGKYKDSFATRQLGYFNGYLTFSHQLQQARQQIYPRFAQVISVSYRTALHSVTANQFLAAATFYFPGIALTHNLVVNLAFQHRDTLNQYRYSNSFPFARGYEAPNLRNMFKWGVNYHFPVCYPDWGFGNIVYFQRIRLNGFYDYTTGIVPYSNGLRINTRFRSTGGEIYFDTKWWNELPLNIGFRYSRLLDRDLYGGAGANRFEFIVPINLFQR